MDPLTVIELALEASRGRDLDEQAATVLAALHSRGYSVLKDVVLPTMESV